MKVPLLILLIAVVLQAGQQTATIQGTVARAGTGQPLKRARVNLRRAGGGNLSNLAVNSQVPAQIIANTQAVTDDSGRFVFSNVAPGDYRIAVDHDGYIHQEYGARSYKGQGMTISISTGQQLGNIDFQMTPTGSISGRILDEDGEPMVNVQVQAETFTYQQGRRTLVPSGQVVQTNDLGEYRIYWLNPRDYFITAVSRRSPMPQINPIVSQQVVIARGSATGGIAISQAGPQQSDEAYAPTYFPGSAQPENATLVPVPPGGDVRGMDFMIHPTHTVTIKGQVVMPLSSAMDSSKTVPIAAERGTPGARVSGGPQINVMLSRSVKVGNISFGGIASNGLNRGANIHPDGTFEIPSVIPGSYILGGFSQQNGLQYSARVAIDVSDRGLDNVSLTLRPGISIPGRIYVDGSLPNGDKLSQMRVVLQLDDFTTPLPGPRGGNAQVADDGSFLLTNIAAMTYRVRVIGPSGLYVLAGRIGNDDAVNQPFTISGDQDVNLQLQVGFSTGKITGTAVDEKGNPYPGAMVTLVPNEPARLRTDLYFSASSDQYGHFSFSNIPAGGYKLFAWEEMSDGAYQDPEFIRQYEGHGVSVKVENGGAVDQQVGVIRQ